MFYRLAAEGVLLLHLAFIMFVILGAAAVLRWRWLAAVHVPAAIWGFFIELTGGVCPLTYVENCDGLISTDTSIGGIHLDGEHEQERTKDIQRGVQAASRADDLRAGVERQ